MLTGNVSCYNNQRLLVRNGSSDIVLVVSAREALDD